MNTRAKSWLVVCVSGVLTACDAAPIERDEPLASTGPAPVISAYPAPTATVGYTPCVNPVLHHCGNVNVASQGDADLYEGIQVIYGDLRIKAGHLVTKQDDYGTHYKPGLKFSMPSLVRVTGNVTIDGDRVDTITFKKLKEVGGSLKVTLRRYATYDEGQKDNDITELKTPVLENVLGNVWLVTARDDSASTHNSSTFLFDLNHVTTIGGDLKIDNPLGANPSHPCGLTGLTTLAHDLTINWPAADLQTQYLLESLDSVDGNVSMATPSLAHGGLDALTHIGGNLALTATPPHSTSVDGHFMPLLSEIEGDLTMTGISFSSNRLPSLARVGGALTFGSARLDGSLGSTGANPLRVGSLTVSNSTKGCLPFHPDFGVLPSAAVVVENNVDLCPDALQSFLAQLTQGGWVGSPVLSGNGMAGACCACGASCL